MLWKNEQKHTESIQTFTTCLLWNGMKSFWVFFPNIWLDLFIMLRSNVQTRKNNNNKQMFFYTCLARTIQTFISLSHKQINNIDLLGFVFTHFCLFWKFALALEKPNVFMFVLFSNGNYLWLRLILFVFLFIDWWIGIANVAHLASLPLGCPCTMQHSMNLLHFKFLLGHQHTYHEYLPAFL